MFYKMDTIHSQAKALIEPLLQKVCNECKSSVDSAYLYGAVVTDDYVPKQTAIQSLILFDDFHFPRAKQLQPLIKAHLKNGVVAPLCLSVETLERSMDTFPLEFTEIKEKHLHVYGEIDRVNGLVIPKENLRLKIEEQIKGKLIRLREVYMEIGEQPKDLLAVMNSALNDLVPALRNLLKFLEDETPPVSTGEMLKKLNEKTDFSIQVLQQVWDHHQNIRQISKEQALTCYGEMTDVLLNLSKVIDRWQTS